MRGLDRRWLWSRWLLVPLVVLIANAVAFSAWTWPLWQARTVAAGGGDDEVDAARELVEPRLERARATFGRVVEAADRLAALRSEAVTAGSAADILSRMQEAADASGLSVEEISVETAYVGELGLVELGMSVPVRGPYRAIRELLERLTGDAGFFVVRSVALAPLDDAPGGQSGVPAGGDGLRIDLAVSGFLDAERVGVVPDERRAPQLTTDAGSAGATPPGRRAAGNTPPLERAQALAARLDGLPELPVRPDAFAIGLERLRAEPGPLPPPLRNPFAFATAPPAPVVELPEPEPVDEMEEPVEPPFPLQLLGTLRVDGVWKASLTDGLELHVVAPGARLPGGYEIVEVGNDYVEVADGDRRVRLVLEESGR